MLGNRSGTPKEVLTENVPRGSARQPAGDVESESAQELLRAIEGRGAQVFDRAADDTLISRSARGIVIPTRSVQRGDYHPTFATGSMPYTSPVSSFAGNAFGLHDMMGTFSPGSGNGMGLTRAPAILLERVPARRA